MILLLYICIGMSMVSMIVYAAMEILRRFRNKRLDEYEIRLIADPIDPELEAEALSAADDSNGAVGMEFFAVDYPSKEAVERLVADLRKDDPYVAGVEPFERGGVKYYRPIRGQIGNLDAKPMPKGLEMTAAMAGHAAAGAELGQIVMNAEVGGSLSDGEEQTDEEFFEQVCREAEAARSFSADALAEQYAKLEPSVFIAHAQAIVKAASDPSYFARLVVASPSMPSEEPAKKPRKKAARRAPAKKAKRTRRK